MRLNSYFFKDGDETPMIIIKTQDIHYKQVKESMTSSRVRLRRLKEHTDRELLGTDNNIS